MSANRKLLVVDIAALGWNLVSHLPEFQPGADASFPAVTCTVAGELPHRRGAAGSTAWSANGLFFRDLRKVLFWEQSAALVRGAAHLGGVPRARQEGGHDVLAAEHGRSGRSHRHAGADPQAQRRHDPGLLHAAGRACRQRLNEAIGRPFNLMNYWGPLANHKSSDWIVDAIVADDGHAGVRAGPARSPTSRTSTTISSATARTSRSRRKVARPAARLSHAAARRRARSTATTGSSSATTRSSR